MEILFYDETCWGLGCKALRTTREDTIPQVMRNRRESKRTERRREWLDEEQGRLDAGRSPRVMPEAVVGARSPQPLDALRFLLMLGAEVPEALVDQ